MPSIRNGAAGSLSVLYGRDETGSDAVREELVRRLRREVLNALR
jgi:hypothetical protein